MDTLPMFRKQTASSPLARANRIVLPPLRERPEDIRWLTERLLASLVLEQGRPLAMSETFLRDIMGREWRGNVRELRSYLEQALVMSDGGLLDTPLALESANAPPNGARTEPIAPLQSILEGVERTHIRKALSHCEGSVGKTAEVVGISRKTLWEKMRKLSITA
ncbi:helix-turn-helix domain-containing protein [Hydrogenophaga sp. SL48]|uniref:helix-turn-helix domain-containing protein n=1 Tax=Hydrogenophaga sp. SL48 TaxID=2806347 RepID=UPI001F46D345|nr:helix-turn-helix domain-containing protein [Hydrogenophaga sp. SL48]